MLENTPTPDFSAPDFRVVAHETASAGLDALTRGDRAGARGRANALRRAAMQFANLSDDSSVAGYSLLTGAACEVETALDGGRASADTLAELIPADLAERVGCMICGDEGEAAMGLEEGVRGLRPLASIPLHRLAGVSGRLPCGLTRDRGAEFVGALIGQLALWRLVEGIDPLDCDGVETIATHLPILRRYPGADIEAEVADAEREFAARRAQA